METINEYGFQDIPGTKMELWRKSNKKNSRRREKKKSVTLCVPLWINSKKNKDGEMKKSSSTIKMAARLREELSFHTRIQGTINDHSFTVEGTGSGNSSAGTIKGKWVCTSGKLPCAWATISQTLGYGYKFFANFPEDMTHFYRESMPKGYTQDRTVDFHNDGTLVVHHDIFFKDGIMKSKVNIQGEGFKPYSTLLTDGVECFMLTEERTFPYENGLKGVTFQIYPLNDGSGEYVEATQTTVNRPLGKGRDVAVPPSHFLQCHLKQYKDDTDDSDHIVMEEVMRAVQWSLLEC